MGESARPSTRASGQAGWLNGGSGAPGFSVYGVHASKYVCISERPVSGRYFSCRRLSAC
jgi:hypothetical protein